MKLNVFAVAVATLMITACTSSPEGKITQVMEIKIGKKAIMEKTSKELDTLLGKDSSKLKSSVIDFMDEKTKVSFSDIQVNGPQATVKVNIDMPKADEIGGLLFLAAFIPKETAMKMSINELLKEVSKGQRQVASINDLKMESYSAIVDLEFKDQWLIKNSDLSKIVTKKNKVK